MPRGRRRGGEGGVGAEEEEGGNFNVSSFVCK